jgi:hypothetical protein
MDDQRRDFPIATHVEAIAARTAAESTRVADRLLGRSWPGGPADRSERAALDWLRRWRPRGPAVPAPICGCATGRCVVCN